MLNIKFNNMMGCCCCWETNCLLILPSLGAPEKGYGTAASLDSLSLKEKREKYASLGLPPFGGEKGRLFLKKRGRMSHVVVIPLQGRTIIVLYSNRKNQNSKSRLTPTYDLHSSETGIYLAIAAGKKQVGYEMGGTENKHTPKQEH